MGIDHGGPLVAMADQFLNCADIVIILQEMAGITVAEGMGGSPFADLSTSTIPSLMLSNRTVLLKINLVQENKID